MLWLIIFSQRGGGDTITPPSVSLPPPPLHLINFLSVYSGTRGNEERPAVVLRQLMEQGSKTPVYLFIPSPTQQERMTLW